MLIFHTTFSFMSHTKIKMSAKMATKMANKMAAKMATIYLP